VNDVKDCPRDPVRCKEMAKESTDVSKLVGLVSMDGVVVLLESLLEIIGPDSVEFTKSFTNETVEIRI